MKPTLSHCCKSPVNVGGTGGLTKWYECSKCGKVCDPLRQCNRCNRDMTGELAYPDEKGGLVCLECSKNL